MGGSSSTSAQTSTTNNLDRRITTGAGNIWNLSDNTIGEGNILNIESLDAAVAQGAFDVVSGANRLAASLSDKGLATANSLANSSNAIAAQVADSQRAFVETASGQKTILYVIGGIALGGLALVMLRKK